MSSSVLHEVDAEGYTWYAIGVNGEMIHQKDRHEANSLAVASGGALQVARSFMDINTEIVPTEWPYKTVIIAPGTESANE